MQTAELKSWRNGLLNELLLVVPTAGTWEEAWSRVEVRLEEAKAGASWQGALLTVDLGMRPVSYEELSWLTDRLRTIYGMLTVAVVATDNLTRESAKHLNLNAYLMLPGASKAGSEAFSRNNALYLSQTVRSGQRIAHEGHIVVGGDVNAGGEVIAGGDIVIVGTLRGLAHAGSQGDESARIFAGVMRPQQLRIAGQIARSPEESAKAGKTQSRPEVARIEGGIIQVHPV